MKRVLIMGGSGSGKSTIARELGHLTKLPVIHMDPLYWNEGWIEKPKNETRRLILDAIKAERWIFDGNHLDTLTQRLDRADTVVFLDIATFVRLWRVLKRSITQLGQTRSDMADGCPERIDFSYLVFLRFVLGYYFDGNRKEALKSIEAAPPGVRIFHLRNSSDLRGFLRSVKIT